MKPTVLLDVDGVVADFITPALAVVASLGGPVLEHDDLAQWDIDQLLPEDKRAGYSRRVAAEGFCRSLAPYPGAQDAVHELRKIADVVFVTASMGHSRTWAHERTLWLGNLFGADPKRDVIHTHAKHRVVGDVFVDDSPEHVVAWAHAHPRGTPLLRDRGYNRASTLPRTSAWSTVLTVARAKAKGEL